MLKVIPVEVIAQKIVILRGQKVMLDKDLAQLYGVKSIALRQQVKRNRERFPNDFTFQLSKEEVRFLVSQIVIPSLKSLGGYRPYAFTEQGVAMLSSVLHSRRAIHVNVQIMRTFVKLKGFLSVHVALEKRMAILEKKFGSHDKKINIIFEAIKQLLLSPPESDKPRIGFHPNK